MNREISWLSFNERVLQEAADERNPVVERIRFLGIYSNNLDEFFRVRVATIRRLIDLKKSDPHALDFNPESILERINEINLQQQKQFDAIQAALMARLEQENIFIVDEKQLSPSQQVYVRDFFDEHVRPGLFPVMIRNLKRATFIRDKAIYLGVWLQHSANKQSEDFSLIKIPTSQMSRFIVLPTEGEKKYAILLDDLIRFNLATIFSIFEFDTFSAYTIKITRDAELDIDNDVSKSFIERISESLKQRRRGRPVRFVYDQDMPKPLFKNLVNKLKITGKDNLVAGGRYHNFRDFMSFPNLGGAGLEYPAMPPLPHPALNTRRSILDVVKERDVMLHLPYHSFHHIIDLLREASIDHRVKSIKMTIYRAAKNSKVINALINAARNGKQVTVFMELQARFDEQANIFWSEKMQEEGVRIIHGSAGLKVHSKLILIKRKENKSLVAYANVGTGNFNEETARLYGDDSLLTSHPKITQEVDNVFGMFEQAYATSIQFKHLVVSPFRTRRFFMRLIDNEIKNARAGKQAEIFLKMNSLVDEEFVLKLYKASQAGVRCRLIVRGMCVLVPGIKGISEHIEGISIVDRYLEHSRVFIFHNGGDERYFISSADFMTRNLDHRIEVACPVLDKGIQAELRAMMDLQWRDNVKARKIDAKQKNEYRTTNYAGQVRSQQAIYDYLRTLR